MFNHLKKVNVDFFFSVWFFIYFIKRAIGDYCLMILVFLCHLSVERRWGMVTREVDAMYFLLNITLIYPIPVFSLKKTFSYIIFVKSGLTSCTKWLLQFFQDFLYHLKTQSNKSRVSDCYLTPTQQCSAISWRDQVNFQWDDVRFVLNQDT